MSERVSITTTFIFERGMPWMHLTQFKRDLAGWIKTYGEYTGETIEGVGDQGGNIIVLLEEKKEMKPPQTPNVSFNKKK